MTTESQRMIRLPQVMEITGMRKTFIYEAIKKGDFPQGIKMGERCTAWIESQIKEWVDARISEALAKPKRKKA